MLNIRYLVKFCSQEKPMAHSSEILIALGSNLGRRHTQIRQAVTMLEDWGARCLNLSQLIETEPEHACDRNFINGAAIFEFSGNPLEFLDRALIIENKLGRQRTVKKGNRTIDIDLLLVKSFKSLQNGPFEHVNSARLTLPHPEMLKRPFVMIPALQIAGDWWHPDAGCTLSSAWRDH
jgi:2-amino-4-hydroxy-6-hydroxymethyldihydropteridine diphosphokinase